VQGLEQFVALFFVEPAFRIFVVRKMPSAIASRDPYLARGRCVLMMHFTRFESVSVTTSPDRSQSIAFESVLSMAFSIRLKTASARCL